MRVFRVWAALVLAAVLFSGVGAQPAGNGASDARPAAVSITGIGANVSVSRDGRGVPYISAANEADLYFMQGYQTAADRLWQMDLFRRVARGEMAEIFGKPALEEDKRWRRFGFARIAGQSLVHVSPEVRAALDAYARGVNAYIATLDEKTLPVEFRILQYQPREWTAADSMVIGKILADALSSTYGLDLLRQNLAVLDKHKFEDLFHSRTDWDVILFGKDSQQWFGNPRPFLKRSTGIFPAETQSGREEGKSFYSKLAENAEERKAFPAKTQSSKEEDKSETLIAQTKTRISLISESSVDSEDPEDSTDPTDSIDYALRKDTETREASLRRIGFYAEGLAASNNWVISGKRTADGRAILANDPHLRPGAPGIWYLTHLEAPGMRVAGVTFPGVPGVVLGHNENIAWGATNVGPDVQDLYLETFNEKGEYKTPDGWMKPVVRREEIRVRTNPLKPDTTVETLEVTETRNGPVIIDAPGVRYSLKWTAFDPRNDEFGAFYYLNRAQDWASFTTALKGYGGAMQNFVYADVKGNIGWYAAGKVPKRNKGDGSVPYDGSTDDGEWRGAIPFAELPHLYNPPSGFIITANQRIVGTDYKHPELVREFAAPWRARRLYDLISADTKATAESTALAQHDSFNIPLDAMAKYIVEKRAASPETLELVKDWDGRMMPESRAALLVNELQMCAGNKMAEANKPTPAGMIRDRVLRQAMENNWTRWLPTGVESYEALMRSCDAESAATLAKRYGADRSQWTWGRVNAASLKHPLESALFIGAQFKTPTEPIAGSGQTPNVGSNVSMRHISTPGNWDATRFVVPLGQSGDPASPHYKDQFDDWKKGITLTLPFTPNAVRAAAKRNVNYLPAGK